MSSRIRIPRITGAAFGAGRALDDLADTIANPPPDRPIARRVGEAGQRFCNFFGARPAVVIGALGPAAGTAALACEPYWKDRGYDPPRPAVPIPGGQCPVLYNVNFTVASRTSTDCQGVARTDTSTTPNISILSVLGPITEIKVEATGDTFVCNSALGAILTNGRFSVTGANGTKKSGNIGPLFSQRRFDRAAFSVSVVRQDGQPDNCGNAPGEYIPGGNPPPDPGDYPSGDEPGVDTGTDDPYFTAPDIPNPVGGPSLPTGDPFTPIPGTGGGGGVIPPGGGGVAGGTESTGSGGEAEGEAPPGSVLVGLQITSLTPPQFVQPQPTGIYRAAAYIRMGTEQGLDLDPAGSTLGAGQFVLAETDFLTKWRVNANVGFDIDVTPYYREVAE